ncbi:MAG: PEP-CTERM sorting domain-containing protein [Isosphaeraceae bacterium]
MRRASRFLAIAFLVAALSTTTARAQSPPQTTLADLLNGGSITWGDKIFFNFHNATTSGTLDVAYDQIFVDCVTGGLNDDEIGLRFSSSLWDLNGANQSYDLGFDFSVTRIDGLPLISDNTLEITGGFEGDGHADIAEGVTDRADGSTLANKYVYFDALETKLIDHQLFEHLAAIIDISKDFKMRTGEDPDSRVFVSHFDQTFSQAIPEPTSVIMLGVGAGTAGLVTIRRRRSRS